MIHLALAVGLSTLALGLLGAVALRRLPAVRAQLAAFGLLAVVLPLAAVLLSGWVMFHMGADVKILAVAAGAAASAVAVALVLAASITRPLEELSAASDRLAEGDLTARAPTGGPRELAKLGRSFNAMASELESLFDARRELIAAASHDLRTPVASITAMLEAIEDGLAEPEEYLAPLHEHARRLGALVDDLFELARIDAGALSHELQIVAVAPLVDSCVRGVEAVARARRVTLDKRLGEAPLVLCAPDQVERVLSEPAHERTATHAVRRRDRRPARLRRGPRHGQRRGHGQRPHSRGDPPDVRPVLAQRPREKRRYRPRPGNRPRAGRGAGRPDLGRRSRNGRRPHLLHTARRVAERESAVPQGGFGPGPDRYRPTMPTRSAEPDAPHRQHYNVTFALLAVAGVSYALLQSLVAPALPDIQRALHTSVNSVSWVLTAYLLSASIATPVIGRLGDMHGKERLLMIVLVLLAVGTVVSAVATTLAVMLVGRVIQGAAGGVFPLAFGIIRDEFPRARVAGGIGLMSALLGVGGGIGVVLSGPIADHLSYHYLFWLPLIPIVIATALIQVFVPESPIRIPGRVNWAGTALMSTGLAAVLIAVSETATWHWLSAKTIGCISLGVVLLACWVRSESRSAHPLVDMRMMRIRGVWTTNLVAMLLGFGMYSSFILLPEYVETSTKARLRLRQLGDAGRASSWSRPPSRC